MIEHDESLKPSTNYRRGCRCMACARWCRAKSLRNYYKTRGGFEPVTPRNQITFVNGPLRGQERPDTDVRFGTITVDGHQYGSSNTGTGGRINYVWLSGVGTE